MEMRDRLIELLQTPIKITTGVADFEIKVSFYEAGFIADHLLSNGVILPPCKVEDIVYYPAFNINKVLLFKVVSIKLNSNSWCIVCENCAAKTQQITYLSTEIGKTVFLTKEEAEKALKEREGNG